MGYLSPAHPPQIALPAMLIPVPASPQHPPPGLTIPQSLLLRADEVIQ